jgi:hypothetical protein
VSVDGYRKDYITVCQVIELGTPGLLSNNGLLDSNLQRCAVCHEDEVQNISFYNMGTQQAVCNRILMVLLGIELYITLHV